jgi:hypothetical protein
MLFSSLMNESMKATSAVGVIHVYHEGGNIGAVIPQTAEQLVAAAGMWNASIAADAIPYSVTLAPYSLAGGPRPPNEVELAHQKEILTRCARLRTETNDVLNKVEYVLGHQADFEGVDVPALETWRVGLALDLDIITQAASFAIENPKGALEPESFARDIKLLPNFKLTIVGTMPKMLEGAPQPLVIKNLIGGCWNDIVAVIENKVQSQAQLAFMLSEALAKGGGPIGFPPDFFTDERIQFILKANFVVTNADILLKLQTPEFPVFRVQDQFPTEGIGTLQTPISIVLVQEPE